MSVLKENEGLSSYQAMQVHASAWRWHFQRGLGIVGHSQQIVKFVSGRANDFRRVAFLRERCYGLHLCAQRVLS